MSRPPDVAVVGAGVFGLSIALRLAWSGRSVQVLDAGAGGAPNASAVAAGMLAPVGETLAEGGDRAHLTRLLAARDLWPAFCDGVPGLVLHRAGSDLLCGDAAGVERIIALICGWGIDFSPLPPPRLGVHAPDDWRLDAPAALAALRAALRQRGVEVRRAVVRPAAGGGLVADGAPLRAEITVIAGGYGAANLAPAAPELAQLTPIKGQLAVFAPGGGGDGPSLNDKALYVVPQRSGARAGATMQAGVGDVTPDAAVLAHQHAAALRMAPQLAGCSVHAEAGVRAATPDGWPLVGPSATPGVWIASGARRNGWLLAPLISQMILDAITGAEAHPLAQAFHPGRFTR